MKVSQEKMYIIELSEHEEACLYKSLNEYLEYEASSGEDMECLKIKRINEIIANLDDSRN